MGTYSVVQTVNLGSGSLWVGRKRPWRSAGQTAPLCRPGAAWTGGNPLWPPFSLHQAPVLLPCLEASSVRSLESTGNHPIRRETVCQRCLMCSRAGGQFTLGLLLLPLPLHEVLAAVFEALHGCNWKCFQCWKSQWKLQFTQWTEIPRGQTKPFWGSNQELITHQIPKFVIVPPNYWSLEQRP